MHHLIDSPLAQYSAAQLRAWADARVISSARYVEEMERRKMAAAREIFGSIARDADGVDDGFMLLTEDELIAGLADAQ